MTKSAVCTFTRSRAQKSWTLTPGSDLSTETALTLVGRCRAEGLDQFARATKLHPVNCRVSLRYAVQTNTRLTSSGISANLGKPSHMVLANWREKALLSQLM